MPTTRDTMRTWGLVATVVMVLGGCGGYPLLNGRRGRRWCRTGCDAGGADSGCWFSAATGASLELLPSGAFTLVLPNGEDSKGTWTSDASSSLTFFFPSGAPQATWDLSLTASSLTLSSGGGRTTWVFARAVAAACPSGG